MLTPYHAKYFAYELTKNSPSDSIQKLVTSLMDAQVDLNPHQVEAALFAFRSPLSTGAILADEVGLGKTIEAGLVISQKWAERKRKILIIVPSNLRKQWNQELLDKFFLNSILLETKSFNDEIKKGILNPFDQKEIIICSYQFARKQESYIHLINWDLVVIDEAHRLRNVYKPNNKIANSIKNSIANAPKILLTATPLQNSLLELFGLVSFVDEYAFGDLKSFRTQYSRLVDENIFNELKARLMPICIRTLRRQVLEFIRYTKRIPMTQEFFPSDEEQRLYDLVSEYLQSEKLFALPPSQRQLMTLILRKLLASSTYAISGTLLALSQKLDVIIESSQVIETPVENELQNNYEEYEEIKEEWEVDEKKESDTYSKEQIEEIKKESKKLKEYFELARAIQINSKGEVLLTALHRGIAEIERLGAKRKAIIFTESTRTQQYLFDLLNRTAFQNKIVLFNGSNSDHLSNEIYQKWLKKHQGTDRVTGSKTADKRAAIIEYFKDEAEIMIATEAAAEGVNLQFCSLVVNYDLPWNPQRIEQRIGRCHRYGQEYDVVVVNFLNKKNAADQRVYQLLDEKFQLFSGVFGASDEVLGAIESGVDFEKRIVEIYQKCRTAEEINLAFDELQKSFEPQIDETINITRQKLLENFDQDVIDKLRVNFEQSKDYLNRYQEWLWNLTKHFLTDYANFDPIEHSFYLHTNPFPQEIIHPGPYRITKDGDDVNIYRIGHPLAQKIIEECKSCPIGNFDVIFTYKDKIISIIEPFINKSGWLTVQYYSISSFEQEDYVILSAFTNDGIVLDLEQCSKLFLLEGNIIPNQQTISNETKLILTENLEIEKQNILSSNKLRNAQYFDEEINKLECWADDLKGSLELELKELDREIGVKKSESRKILNLEEKVSAQREIKDMEKKRNELRRNLFLAQDEVDKRKEKIIEDIEARLQQKIETKELFTIRWSLI
jgi:ERCC4-related helicase